MSRWNLRDITALDFRSVRQTNSKKSKRRRRTLAESKKKAKSF
jgi:hypothetical protein